MSEHASPHKNNVTANGPDFMPPRHEASQGVYNSAEIVADTVSPGKDRSSIGKNILYGTLGAAVGAGTVLGLSSASFGQDAEKPISAASASPFETIPSSDELGAQLSGEDYRWISHDAKIKAQETLVRAWATDNESDSHNIISGTNRWGTKSYTTTEIEDGSGKSKLQIVQVDLELVEGINNNNTVVVEAWSDETCTENSVDSFTGDEAKAQADCPVPVVSEKLRYEFSGMHIPPSVEGEEKMEVRNRILDALELRSTKLMAIEHLVTTVSPSGESTYDASRIEIDDDYVVRAIGGTDGAYTRSELLEVLNADFLES